MKRWKIPLLPRKCLDAYKILFQITQGGAMEEQRERERGESADDRSRPPGSAEMGN